ncbi:MAG: class I SAM-dependent methyltransferase, partial [Oscillospiraceae bacterium]|nr:class I SAM-dependent methyltransferase [Oscillospiraceae bacterium]
MDNEKRIYGESFDIDASRTRELYNKRSERLSQMQNPYTSVLLGDQNPEYAVKWNAIEKETILPLLGVEKTSSVLDLGCGIGRWAETVIPLCGQYTGVDFSEGMVKT